MAHFLHHDILQPGKLLYLMGCNRPHQIKYLNRPVLISASAWLKKRRPGKGYGCYSWRLSLVEPGLDTLLFLDAGSFSCLSRNHGLLAHLPTRKYAKLINRFCGQPWFLGAATQDYLCSPDVLNATGLTVSQHQALTIHRYDRLRQLIDPSLYLMPVLQGAEPEDYQRHLKQWGTRLEEGQWMGIGSVAQLNNSLEGCGKIVQILNAVLDERPDLKLHLFGIKEKALSIPLIRGRIASADSGAFGLNSSQNSSQGRKVRRFQYADDWKHQLRQVEALENEPCPLLLE